MKTALMVLAAVAMAGCNDGADGTATGDSTSRFERGLERVGEKLETAAQDVGTEMSEAKVQMILDNIVGFDSVKAERADDGTVTLVGGVATAEQSADAEKLVRSIKGVAGVKNSLSVGGVAPAATTDSAVVRDSAVAGDSARR